MNPTKDAWLFSPGRQLSSSSAGAWPSRLRAGCDHLRTLWVARRQRAQARATLQSFSDRELWDLGLSRSDIPAIIKGTYRRS